MPICSDDSFITKLKTMREQWKQFHFDVCGCIRMTFQSIIMFSSSAN